MTAARALELALAIVILGAGVLLYRRRPADGEGYGSQGAVLLLVVAAIVAVHALGLMHYRPSAAEVDMARQAPR